jgi:hypothetical protein
MARFILKGGSTLKVFAPGTKDGEPVPILMTAEVTFALR